MAKSKKREATPSSHKVSPASVDAPPAPALTKGQKISRGIRAKQIEALSGTPDAMRGKPASDTLSDGLPTVNPDIPEELQTVWDSGIAETFKALLPKQQTFLLHYIQCWNAAESYRKSHNPLASDHVASANGSRLIANDGISLILQKFANQKTEALFLVQKTYNDAALNATKPIFGKDEEGQPILVLEQPDYAVRVKAAEAISKLHGLNQPAEVKHSGEITSKVVQVQLPTKKPA